MPSSPRFREAKTSDRVAGLVGAAVETAVVEASSVVSTGAAAMMVVMMARSVKRVRARRAMVSDCAE
jgi:hypothetical protein